MPSSESAVFNSYLGGPGCPPLLDTCLRLNLDTAPDRSQIGDYLMHEMVAFAVGFGNPTQLWHYGPLLCR